MSLAESPPRRWHFFGSIAFRAARIAMASPPIAGADRPAVKFAQSFLPRTASLLDTFIGSHPLSITSLRIQKQWQDDIYSVQFPSIVGQWHTWRLSITI